MTQGIKIYALRTRKPDGPFDDWDYFASEMARNLAAADAVRDGLIAWSQDLDCQPTAGAIIRLLEWSNRK